jgi:hypothetical protein
MSPAVMKLFTSHPPTWDEVAEALGQSGSEEMIVAARQLLLTEGAFERITDRQYLINEGNYAERLAFYALCRCLHRRSWTARKRALPRRSGFFTPLRGVNIDPGAGFAVVDVYSWGLAQLAIDEAAFCFARAVAKHLPNPPDPTEPVPSPKPFMRSYLMRLARHPAVVRIVGEYLGGVPILLGVRLVRRDSASTHDSSSSFYHLDVEDFRQVKMFLTIQDSDSDKGLLHLFRADHSEQIQVRTDYRLDNRQLRNETIKAYGARPTVCTGRRGTLVFADTSRCFHLEKPPTNGSLNVAVFEYVTPASPLFSVNKRIIKTKIAEAAAAAGLDGRLEKLLLGMSR